MNRLFSVLAILVTVTILGMMTIGTQQVFAPRDCADCGEFKKLTSEFEKDVISSIVDQNSKTSHAEESSIQDFKQITKEFQKEMLKTVEFRNVTGGGLLDKPEFVDTYSEDVLRIFPNGPVPALLETYLGNVAEIFGFRP
jgi:hypothetical protein